MTTIGMTTWAVNRIGWAFGYYPYSNPYVGSSVVAGGSTYDYSQPIIVADDQQTEESAAGPPEAPPEGVSPDALSEFDSARQQFYSGQYSEALASVDNAIEEMPKDAVLHEFRALTLFALGKYEDAAATLYAVLSAGPGWDWTTMSGLYPSVEPYTEQLRALEAFARTNPNDPAPRLMLAYHYGTAGHSDAAKNQLNELLKLTPDDPLVKNLLLQIDPDTAVPSAPDVSTPPEVDGTVMASDLIGDWQAARDDQSMFEMQLDQNSAFKWTFTQQGKQQTLEGTYSVDEQGVLTMDTGGTGTMLAQIVPQGETFDFYLLGDTQGVPPLRFSRAR